LEKNLDQFYKILIHLISECHQLLKLVTDEKRYLIQVDFCKIRECIQFKKNLIQHIRELENLYVKQFLDIAGYWNLPHKKLIVSQFMIQLEKRDPKEAEKFFSTFKIFFSVIQGIKSKNLENAILIQHSLKHIKKMKMHLSSQLSCYDIHGQSLPTVSTKRLLLKEA